jgi:hypothetical protein
LRLRPGGIGPVVEMVQIAGEVVIEAPPAEVFDFVADERNIYDPRIRHAEKISQGPIGVGTRFRTESRSAGRSVAMIVEVTTYERPPSACHDDAAVVDGHPQLARVRAGR